MRRFNYLLTPARINNAKPEDKPSKLTDGGGLFVLVSPRGEKNWRYQCPVDGKRCAVTIGRHPEIRVADARDQHAEYRTMVECAVCAALDADEGQFKAFSLKWIDERLAGRTDGYVQDGFSVWRTDQGELLAVRDE